MGAALAMRRNTGTIFGTSVLEQGPGARGWIATQCLQIALRTSCGTLSSWYTTLVDADECWEALQRDGNARLTDEAVMRASRGDAMPPVVFALYLEQCRQTAMENAKRLTSAAEASGTERSERAANRTGAHAAPSRLDFGESMESKWGFSFGTASECCQQYKSREAAKEGVQAPPLAPQEALHIARLANMPRDCDPAGFISGCAAMANGVQNFVLREKSAEQATELRHDGRHAFATISVDRKKRKYQLDRTACTTLADMSGRTVWFQRWKEVLDGWTEHSSLIRDHDGQTGDPRGATKWLHQRMPWKRFGQMLHALFLCDAVYGAGTSYPPPNLGKARLEAITPQSLKHTCPAIGPLIGIPLALAESGAWAGSSAERASAVKMMADAIKVPTGLETALLYARRGSQATAPLVMECIIASARLAIAECSSQLRQIPDTWEELLEGHWRPAQPVSRYPALTIAVASPAEESHQSAPMITAQGSIE